VKEGKVKQVAVNRNMHDEVQKTGPQAHGMNVSKKLSFSLSREEIQKKNGQDTISRQ
jgi:hypothetical protein